MSGFMFTGVIYRWVSPTNRSYIGQTINPLTRYNDFLNTAKTYGGLVIDRARRKYPPKAWQYSVLEVISKSSKDELANMLDEREIFYIQKYDSYHSGYNSTLGGGGVFGRGKSYVHCFLYKVSGDFVGEFSSPSEASFYLFTNFRLSVDSQKLKDTADAVRRSTKGFFLLYSQSELQDRLYWISHKRLPPTLPVISFSSTTGDILATFTSIREAAMFYNISSYTVRNCCTFSTIYSHGSYSNISFIYLRDIDRLSEIVDAVNNFSYSFAKEVFVYSESNFDFVGRFKSIDECYRVLGVGRHLIRQCLSGMRPSSCGFIFSAVKDLHAARRRYVSVLKAYKERLSLGVNVYSYPDMTLVSWFKDISSAAKFTGLGRGNVARYCFSNSDSFHNDIFAFRFVYDAIRS